MNGFINLLKPPGMTSSDAVVFLRRRLLIKKIGHTGTLDPDAAGVLPLALGKATRLSDYVMAKDKVYRFELRLGIETDTGDISGTICAQSTRLPEAGALEALFPEFTGPLLQIPPMVSAIKLDGRKLYELARAGQSVKIDPRPVVIHRLTLLHAEPPWRYFIETECSKGTYIRALCRDIGARLGCGGTLAFLLRTRSGFFSLEQSHTLEEIERMVQEHRLDQSVIPMDEPLSHLPRIDLPSRMLRQISHGNPVSAENIDQDFSRLMPMSPVRVYCADAFAGIGTMQFQEAGPLIRMKNVLL